MPIIKNDDDYVKSLTLTGLNDVAGLELPSAGAEGAEGARVDRECSNTYELGRGITALIKTHLTATFDCMDDTGTIILETDAQAAKNSVGTTKWAKLLGQ